MGSRYEALASRDHGLEAFDARKVGFWLIETGQGDNPMWPRIPRRTPHPNLPKAGVNTYRFQTASRTSDYYWRLAL
jgi:hypothetical protein